MTEVSVYDAIYVERVVLLPNECPSPKCGATFKSDSENPLVTDFVTMTKGQRVTEHGPQRDVKCAVESWHAVGNGHHARLFQCWRCGYVLASGGDCTIARNEQVNADVLRRAYFIAMAKAVTGDSDREEECDRDD